MSTQATNKPKVVAGYMVFTSEDGSCSFRTFGPTPTLIQIMGLHQYAAKRINRLYDSKYTAGDMLTNEVGKAVGALHAKLTPQSEDKED